MSGYSSPPAPSYESEPRSGIGCCNITKVCLEEIKISLSTIIDLYEAAARQLDEPTLAALNRLAAPGRRKRSEFVRNAIRRAVRQAEYREMREAYRNQPDSIDAEDWSTAEEYKRGAGT